MVASFFFSVLWIGGCGVRCSLDSVEKSFLVFFLGFIYWLSQLIMG
jgi:hypothetical protein